MNTFRIKVKNPGRLKVFCFIVFFMAIMLVQDKSLYSQDYTSTRPIVVIEGQSLWNIAEKYKSQNEDIRSFIDKVREINLLEGSELAQGQVIKVPVYSKN
jgi:hypothetical protein